MRTRADALRVNELMSRRCARGGSVRVRITDPVVKPIGECWITAIVATFGRGASGPRSSSSVSEVA
jgi:hypothetical protein